MKRSFAVDILCVLFGLGAWITVNGVWVELPQLVLHLPEGWNLPSYLTVIVQLANIGPITYTLIHVVRPSLFNDVIAVTVTTLIGSVACLMLVFFWKETVFLAGQMRSVPLFALVFFMALIDCTSSILFLPYMSVLKEKYLISYMVGEGLSGFIPSVMALIQGIVGSPECRNVTHNLTGEASMTPVVEPFYPDPAFSTSIFFAILFVMDLTSLCAFFGLNFLPVARKERVPSAANLLRKTKYEVAANEDYNGDHSFQPPSVLPISSALTSDVVIIDEEQITAQNNNRRSLSKVDKFYLLLLQGWLCALSNGVFPSIQSYSGLPYGNKVFHLCVSLSTMANPLACCVAFVLPTRKLSIVTATVVVGTVVSCYLMATAALSPHPPLLGTILGESLVVAGWILFVGSFSYAKTCIASLLRVEGRSALFWCGVCTQAGSALGALIMFILINVYTLFESFNPCAN